MITDILASRTMSSFALSIGTALAMESIAKGPYDPYDKERVIPEKIKLSDYDEFWVNLHSLFRGIVSAVSSADFKNLKAQDVSDAMAAEVQVLRDIVQSESHGKVRLVLYMSKYSGLDKKHPNAKLRLLAHGTDKQKAYHKLATETLNAFNAKQVKGSVDIYDRALTPKEKKKVLIFTHYAYDLLSHGKFKELHLLESHTGLLKKKAQWYTKLSGGKDLMRIPFRVAFMQIFGDSQSFYGDTTKIKKIIIDLANKFEWTSATTDDRVRLSLNTLNDVALVMMIERMLSEDSAFY